jgi:hypothetical protein
LKEKILDKIKDNFFVPETWIRGLFMMLFLLVFYYGVFLYSGIITIIIISIVLFQFCSKLLTGAINQRLLSFGQCLSVYTYQVMRYLTYNTDIKPFPFSAWPNGSENISE